MTNTEYGDWLKALLFIALVILIMRMKIRR